MKIVYIAGKFRGANAWEVHKNVQEALKVGFDVACLGAMPLIPHSNTQPFDGTLSDVFWLDGTLEILRRCDAVMTVGNWINSTGAKAEVEQAKKLGIQVFHDLDKLRGWLSQDLTHVSVFEDDGEEVPSIMMCGLVVDHNEDGTLSPVGHDFYSLMSLAPGSPGYHEAKISEVTCGECAARLRVFLESRT